MLDESFSEFLNRADNIAQLSQYDRDLLEEYNEAKEEVADQEERLQEEKDAIEELKEEREAKEAEVEQLINTTSDQIETYAADIAYGESSAASLLEEINSRRSGIQCAAESGIGGRGCCLPRRAGQTGSGGS